MLWLIWRLFYSLYLTLFAPVIVSAYLVQEKTSGSFPNNCITISSTCLAMLSHELSGSPSFLDTLIPFGLRQLSTYAHILCILCIRFNAALFFGHLSLRHVVLWNNSLKDNLESIIPIQSKYISNSDIYESDRGASRIFSNIGIEPFVSSLQTNVPLTSTTKKPTVSIRLLCSGPSYRCATTVPLHVLET